MGDTNITAHDDVTPSEDDLTTSSVMTLDPQLSTEPEPAPRKVSRLSLLTPVILALLGVGVMLYPVIASQVNNAAQARAAAEYSRQEAKIDTTHLEEVLERAHEYNRTNAGAPILDPWLARISVDNEPYQEYLGQLDILPQMGRLVIPIADIDLPIYHGTNPDVLETGVGHLFGTDLPVGGPSTHAVLTAHSGMSNATLFDNVKNLNIGDSFYIQVAGQKMKYTIREEQVVLPEEVSSLVQRDNQDLVTLITCTPYGVNSHRLLLTGERVPMDEEEAAVFDDGGGLVWQWWMLAALAVAAVITVFFIWWLRRVRRNTQQQALVAVEPETVDAEVADVAVADVEVSDAEAFDGDAVDVEAADGDVAEGLPAAHRAAETADLADTPDDDYDTTDASPQRVLDDADPLGNNSDAQPRDLGKETKE